MNGPPWMAVMTEGGLKRLAMVPRSAVLLVCMFLVILVVFLVIGGFLFTLGDDTAKRVIHVFLADLNGDDQQDAFLVTNQMHRIVFTDGTGDFTSSRELLMYNYALALGDLDGDGSLEAILINFEEEQLKLECADMPPDAVFPARPEGDPDQVFAIRDSNQDGLPGGYIADCCGGGTIMHNYGTLFTNQRSCLDVEGLSAAALGDLNGNGALDVFVVKGWWTPDQRTAPNEVWFNDGLGNFTDSGQRLGNAESYDVALGDLNGDGFLDAAVGNRNGGEIWINDGTGNLLNSGQRLGSRMTHTIFASDLDGDGDLDLILGGNTWIRAWLNDSTGQFKAGQRITYGRLESVAVGDVSGDGLPDLFVGGPDSYRVWRGTGNGRFSADSPSSYR